MNAFPILWTKFLLLLARSAAPSPVTFEPTSSKEMQNLPPKSLFFSLAVGIRTLGMWLVGAAAIASPAYGYSVQIYAVNCGGSAASPFVADAYFSGGGTYSGGASIATSGVTNPAPQAVYQSERYGNSTYTLPSLTPARSYVVRLHFAEIYWSQAGKRIFNVSINGTQVLTNFDIYADAGASNKATIKEFTAAANGSGQIVVGFVGVTDSAKVSGIEILDAGLPDPPFCLNADIDKGSSYSGVGVAPDTGTTWNTLGVGSASSGVTWSNLVSSQGVSGTCSVTLTSSGGISSWSADTPGNPNPLNLMKDYLFGNTYTVTVSGLAQKNYLLYVYAHGDVANQNSTVTVNGANVLSGSGVGVTGTSGSDYRNIFVSGGEGYSYLKFPVSVSTSGTLRFTTASYLNGFQVMEFPKPTITTQPPATPSASVGSNFSMSVSGTGEGTLTYQWRKAGVNLSDVATGNGSSYSGVTTSTFVLNNAQIADSDNYDVVVTNQGGSVTSGTAALTVTTTALPPSIPQGGQPSAQTVLSGSASSFSVTANGTSPLAYQWYKGGSLLTNGTTAQGSTISGATAATLTIANTKLADAGSYYVVVTNAPATTGTATSNSATLTVNQAPTITSQPTGAVIVSGSSYTLSAGFDPGSPAPTYIWQKTIDGANFTTAQSGTSSSLVVTGGTNTSGFYKVTGTNSTGSVTSSLVYVGIPSTTLGTPTFGPSNNATGINRDTPLTLTFAAKPIVGSAGAVRIYDASNDQEVTSAAIDLSQINVFSLTANNTSYGVYHYKTKVIQGDNYYAQPIIAVGSQPAPLNLPAPGAPTVNPNEVRINLPTSTVLTYGKTYYVKIDPGVLIDSTGATYTGISDATTWKFAVKAAGPANGATSLTVGNNGGTSDFSTVQGASDFLSTYSPQPSAAQPVTVNIRNGIYYEIVHHKAPYVTFQGQSRNGTVVGYLINNSTINAPGSPAGGSVSTRTAFRMNANNVTVQNLSIYNLTPNGGGQAEAYLPAGQQGIANHVSVYSYQDTMLLGGTFFMTDSYVEGAVDYIWGGGQAIFRRCELKANAGGAYYTQARNTHASNSLPPNGYALVDCTLSAYAGVPASSCYLSRTFNDFSQTIYINCKMGPHINPQGWAINAGATDTLQLWEYQSKDLNGNLLDVSQRPTYNRAFAVSGTNIVYTAGSTSNDVLDHQQASANLAALFSTPQAFFGGTWSPQVAPTFDTQPASQTVNPGQSATFTAAATAVPDPTYQWYKNNAPIAGGTNSSYTLPSVSGTDWGTYTVVATNAVGSTPSSAASLVVNDPLAQWANGQGLDPATTGAPAADPDNDGVNNKTEFFLGGNPKKADNDAILPVASYSSSNGNQTLVFEFNRNKSASGVSYTVEYTYDLKGTWTTAANGANGVTVETTSVDANFDHIKVTIPITQNKAFARLKL